MNSVTKPWDGFIMLKKPEKTYLLYKFPEQKRKIARLTYDQQMEWYAYNCAQEMIFLGNDPEFKRFWYWNIVIPVRIRRMYYRIKNLEIFKSYEHITDTKKK